MPSLSNLHTPESGPDWGWRGCYAERMLCSRNFCSTVSLFIVVQWGTLEINWRVMSAAFTEVTKRKQLMQLASVWESLKVICLLQSSFTECSKHSSLQGFQKPKTKPTRIIINFFFFELKALVFSLRSIEKNLKRPWNAIQWRQIAETSLAI